MRGSAVPTMVWSRAARKSASPTPTVASVRAVRVMSAATCRLLAKGFDRVLEIGKGRAQARALLGRKLRQQLGDTFGHEVMHALELAASPGGQLDDDYAPIARVLHAAAEPLLDERIDELRERRRRQRAALRQLAAAQRALAQLPEHAHALEGQRTALVGGLRHELAEAGKHGQEKAGTLGVTAGVRTLREPAGHRG